MICFKDMTFCKHFEDCKKRHDCHRPLTEEVRKAAKRWWGDDGAPIAYWSEKPHCHEEE